MKILSNHLMYNYHHKDCKYRRLPENCERRESEPEAKGWRVIFHRTFIVDVLFGDTVAILGMANQWP